MPESPFDRELETLLQYRDPAGEDTFVLNVMKDVQRARRTRRMILWVFGLVGAIFGLAGAVMLSDSITELFAFELALPATQTMQVVLFIVGGAAFYAWFMNDDWSLGG